MEEAFFRFEVEVVKLGNFEDVMYCMLMIRHICTGGDSDVVHVDPNSCTKTFMFENDVAVDVIHHRLESRWRIGKSKIHDRRFKKPVSGFECCLLFVSLPNAYIVVPPANIKFRVDVCVTEVTDKVCN